MTQLEIDTAVANSTGESMQEIRRRGFVLADRLEIDDYPGTAPQMVDWDQLENQWRLFP